MVSFLVDGQGRETKGCLGTRGIRLISLNKEYVLLCREADSASTLFVDALHYSDDPFKSFEVKHFEFSIFVRFQQSNRLRIMNNFDSARRDSGL